MTEPLTLYKLIVLYMLDQVEFPLTKAQIYEFILGREYTNYFTLQQVTNDLIDQKLVTKKEQRNRTQLMITDEGKKTLEFFKGRISDGIKTDITHFFKEHEMEIRNEFSIQSNYYKTGKSEYIAEVIAKEKNTELMNLKLTVPNEESARSICERWETANQEIYAFIMEHLL